MKLKDACSLTNLDIILKSRDITLLTKVPIVKAMVFLVVMCVCESWTIKKAEPWRIDAFELQCWRRLLRVPWTARRSNQSIPKEINPDYSLEGLMLKLHTGPPNANNWLIGKEPDPGKDWGQEEKRATFRRWWRIGKPGMLQSMRSQRVGHNWVTEQQQQTELNNCDKTWPFHTFPSSVRHIWLPYICSHCHGERWRLSCWGKVKTTEYYLGSYGFALTCD